MSRIVRSGQPHRRTDRTRISVVLIGLVLLPVLAGCGSTSRLVSTQPDGNLDLSSYRRVTVHDLRDKTRGKARTAVRWFADLLAEEIEGQGGFDQVSRQGFAGRDTLTVGGVVTRYAEGSSAARFLIGLGAGSSYFDAVIELRGRGRLLAKMTVDKNSWPLGGWIASTQTTESFMKNAARHFARELLAARHSSSPE